MGLQSFEWFWCPWAISAFDSRLLRHLVGWCPVFNRPKAPQLIKCVSTMFAAHRTIGFSTWISLISILPFHHVSSSVGSGNTLDMRSSSKPSTRTVKDLCRGLPWDSHNRTVRQTNIPFIRFLLMFGKWPNFNQKMRSFQKGTSGKTLRHFAMARNKTFFNYGPLTVPFSARWTFPQNRSFLHRLVFFPVLLSY